MKRISRILLAFAMLFVVVLTTACSGLGVKTTTRTFEKEEKENGIKTTIKYTYIEKEDKVLKEVTTTEVPYSIYKGLPMDEIKIKVEAVSARYQYIKGVKESIEYKENTFIEVMEIDYENLDFETANKAFNSNIKDPKQSKVSMEETVKKLTNDGYTEKK